MIAFVCGTVADVRESEVVIDVSGVGYRIMAPTTVTGTLEPGTDGVTIYTSLIAVDNQMNLYGFLTPEDRDIFELLITVSGIGPKAGVKLLSIPKERLTDAIANDDAAVLSTVQGIGPKTAKRVILELKDKIGKLYGRGAGISVVPSVEAGSESEAAIQGLQALGYSASEIRNMIKQLDKKVLKESRASEIIRLCLQKKE